jgi:UDP-3-O-acyl-N-acetylglucosamine deacetylase
MLNIPATKVLTKYFLPFVINNTLIINPNVAMTNPKCSNNKPYKTAVTHVRNTILDTSLSLSDLTNIEAIANLITVLSLFKNSNSPIRINNTPSPIGK